LFVLQLSKSQSVLYFASICNIINHHFTALIKLLLVQNGVVKSVVNALFLFFKQLKALLFSFFLWGVIDTLGSIRCKTIFFWIDPRPHFQMRVYVGSSACNRIHFLNRPLPLHIQNILRLLFLKHLNLFHYFALCFRTEKFWSFRNCCWRSLVFVF